MELSQYLIETFKPVVTIIVEILTILLMNYSFAIENTDQRTMEMVRKMITCVLFANAAIILLHMTLHAVTKVISDVLMLWK